MLADLKAAFARFQADQMTDHAAALTYYSLMSLFPALLFAVAVLGVFGQEALDRRHRRLPQDRRRARRRPSTPSRPRWTPRSRSKSTAITALVIGLALSLNGASGAFGAVGRALNRVWRVDEGRGFVRRKANDLLWTLVVLVLVIVTFVLIFLGGGLASDVLGLARARRHRRRRLAVRALAGGARCRRC